MRYTIISAIVLLFLAASVCSQPTEILFGKVDLDRSGPCITKAQRTQLREQIQANRARLAAEGKLPAANPAAPGQFQWPLRPKAGFTDYGYYGVSGFVDHDPNFPGFLEDYFCGQRTYDLDIGYNHLGTDIFNWPFLWNKMDNDEVEIVAAATGVILLRYEGNFDRNCGLNNSDGNGVAITHGDGSVAIYWHMKNGSVTPKDVGDLVFAGDYLGVVGSSGASGGPHLHLEVFDANNNVIDPWQGNCNNTITESWWVSQKPYYDPWINKISTHFAPVGWAPCPDPDTLNISSEFNLGETVYFYAFGRDGLLSDAYDFTIYRPDGSVFDALQYLFEIDYAAAYDMGWGREIPLVEQAGTWTYELVFRGQTCRQEFVMNPPLPVFFQSVSARQIADAVALDWDVFANEYFEGFVIYRREAVAVQEVPVGDPLGANARSFVDFGAQPGQAYRYVVSALLADGSELRSQPVDIELTLRPFAELQQNHPNPFTPATTIEFTLSEPSPIELAIYDAQGKRVAIVERGARTAGPHQVIWNGRDANGQPVSTGVYFYRLTAGDRELTKKMILIR